MKKNLIAVTLMVVSMGASMDVLAADSAAYWGGSFGYSPASGTDVSGAGGGAGITTSSGFGLGGILGYKINKYAAVEASYTILGMGWKSGVTDVSAGILSWSALGYYPVSDGFDAYGKVGYSNSTVIYSGCAGCTNVQQSKAAMSYGFGIEVGDAQSLRLRLGVDHYDLSAFAGASLNSNYYNAAMLFKF